MMRSISLLKIAPAVALFDSEENATDALALLGTRSSRRTARASGRARRRAWATRAPA